MPRTQRATAGTEPAKRSERETVINLRLPRELYERLRLAAGERGFTAEVRRLLEAALGRETAADPETRQLLDAIAAMAEFVSQPAPWHEDPFAFAVLRAAINRLMAYLQPSGTSEIADDEIEKFAADLAGLGLANLSPDIGAREWKRVRAARRGKEETKP